MGPPFSPGPRRLAAEPLAEPIPTEHLLTPVGCDDAPALAPTVYQGLSSKHSRLDDMGHTQQVVQRFSPARFLSRAPTTSRPRTMALQHSSTDLNQNHIPTSSTSTSLCSSSSCFTPYRLLPKGLLFSLLCYLVGCMRC